MTSSKMCFLFISMLIIPFIYPCHGSLRECDVVIFNPIEKFQTMSQTRTAIIFENHFLGVNSKIAREIPCQEIHINVDKSDLQKVDQYFLSSRIPTRVIAIGSNHSLMDLTERKPYEITFISKLDEKTKHYFPYQDGRWYQIRIAISYYDRIYLYPDKESRRGLIGANLETWDLLSRKLDLSLTFVPNKGGYRGAYGMLAQKKVELVLPGGFMSPMTMKIADQSHYTYLEIFKFYNAKPRPVQAYLSLISPFNAFLWMWVLIATAFAFHAFYLFRLHGIKLSLFNIIRLLLSNIISESFGGKKWQKSYQHWYGYVVLFLWLLYGVLLTASYTSNLLAHLTVVERTKPDNTFEDLVRNKRTLGVPIGAPLGTWLKNSPRAIVRRAEKECAQERGGYYFPNFTATTSLTPPSITPKLNSGEASSLFAISGFGRLEHKYRLGTDVLMETYMSFDMLKRHPLKDTIDKLLGRFADMGILQHAQNRGKWRNSAVSREYARRYGNGEDKELKSLTIEHLATLWMINLVLNALAALIFLSELLNAICCCRNKRTLSL